MRKQGGENLFVGRKRWSRRSFLGPLENQNGSQTDMLPLDWHLDLQKCSLGRVLEKDKNMCGFLIEKARCREGKNRLKCVTVVSLKGLEGFQKT